MIHILCRQQELLARTDAPLVAKSVDVTRFTVETDESWQGLTTEVIFSGPGARRKVLYTGGEAVVPWECLDRPGQLSVTVVGRSGSVQMPTRELMPPLTVLPAGELNGDEPEPPPTPGTAEQAFAIATRAEQRVTALQPRVEAALLMAEASGEGAVTLRNSAAHALRSLTLWGSCTQQGTPTPMNPIPPVRAEQVRTFLAGRNLCPPPDGPGVQTLHGITFTVQSDGGIRVEGIASGPAEFPLHHGTRQIETRARLTFALGGKPEGISWCVWDDWGPIGGRTVAVTESPVTTPEPVEKIGKLRSCLRVPEGRRVCTVVYPRIGRGTEVPAAAPFSTVRTLQLPQTLGGQPWEGKLGAVGTCADRLEVSGDGTGTLAYYPPLRIGDYQWSISVRGFFYMQAAAVPCRLRERAALLCEAYDAIGPVTDAEAGAAPDFTVSTYAHGRGIRVRDSRFANVPDFLAAMGDTVIYAELDCPELRALTATEVTSMLDGAKTHSLGTELWNDGGVRMAVRYAADPKRYIDSRTEPAPDGGYALLETVTVTAGVSTLIRSREPEGRDYRLQGVTVLAELPAASGAVTLQINGHTVGDVLCGAAKGYGFFTARWDHGLVLSQYQTSGGAPEAGTPLAAASSGQFPAEAITELRFTHPSEIPAGTVFTIYGLRMQEEGTEG